MCNLLNHTQSSQALPPIVTAEFKTTLPNRPTVCVYGHLDVQPAALEDGWDSEPFTLEERDGKARLLYENSNFFNLFMLQLWGRGATDDKG